MNTGAELKSLTNLKIAAAVVVVGAHTRGFIKLFTLIGGIVVSAIPSFCYRCSRTHRYYFVSINVTLLVGGEIPPYFRFFFLARVSEGYGRFSRIQFQFLRLSKGRSGAVSLHTFFLSRQRPVRQYYFGGAGVVSSLILWGHLFVRYI